MNMCRWVEVLRKKKYGAAETCVVVAMCWMRDGTTETVEVTRVLVLVLGFTDATAEGGRSRLAWLSPKSGDRSRGAGRRRGR
jgi:hypothetical protein